MQKADIRTVVVLVDQWDPVLHERAEDTNERRMGDLVRNLFQFRSEGTRVSKYQSSKDAERTGSTCPR